MFIYVFNNSIKSDWCTFKDVSAWNVAEGQQLLQKVPGATKRIQIKGYANGSDDKWYLLCTCINNQGKEVAGMEGSVWRSYTDVLIREKAVNTSLKNCDYVFFSAAVPYKTEVCTGASKVKKTTGGDVTPWKGIRNGV